MSTKINIMGFLSFLFNTIYKIFSILGFIIMELLVFSIIFYVVNDMGYTKTAYILSIVFIIWLVIDVIIRIIGTTFTSLYDFLIGRFLR